jgi:hypothetical protein
MCNTTCIAASQHTQPDMGGMYVPTLSVKDSEAASWFKR